MTAWRDKPVIVTGGCGFVGSQLVARLVAEGAKVHVVDDLSIGRRLPPNNVGLWTLDVARSAAQLRHVINTTRAQVVFHLACINQELSEVDLPRGYIANTGGAGAVVQACRTSNEVPRLVNASSVSVLGDPGQSILHDDSPLRPHNHYAIAKAAAEQCVSDYLCGVSVRLSNVYGPGMDWTGRYCGVVGKMAWAAVSGKSFRMTSNGARDYVYVADAVNALMLVGEGTPLRSVYTIGTGKSTDVFTLARLFNIVPEQRQARLIDTIARRTVASHAIRSEFGWKPNVTLREGIKLTKAAALAHFLSTQSGGVPSAVGVYSTQNTVSNSRHEETAQGGLWS